MNKLILSLLLSFSAVYCFAQFPTYQVRSSPTTIIDDKGANQFRKGLVNGRFADTTAANADYIDFYAGAQIVCGDTIWLRNSTATKWINQGPSGSLVSVVTILNDSTILICNINSCDTFVVTTITGPITNITILSDTAIQVCGSDILGAENITNGTFTGSATGWTLGALWNYNTDNIIHNFGSTGSSFQGGVLTSGGTYTVVLDVGGSAGTVTVALDGGGSQTYNAGAGTSTFTGTWTQSQGLKINLIPSNDFDGTIDNVSVKAVLPNCDTLQLTSTNFPIDDTIFVITPLHAAGDDTIYITQAGPSWRSGVFGDSGYLSTAAYDTFLQKVDSLSHVAANGLDILYFWKNGVVVAWDTLTIICDGLIAPGDVVWTGTGLVYDVTSATYRIACKLYVSPPTTITLNAADATNPRIDVIGVDSSGNAVYIPGTAAATPVTPQIDPSYQVYLTSILVPATATVAPIDTVVIYDENSAAPVNWTPVTNVGTTTNAANTLNPFRGTLSVDVTNINNGDNINFTNNTTTDLSLYQSVVLYIRLKAVIPAAANVRIQWLNSTTIVSNFVTLAINKSNITTYQAMSVPLSLFTLTNNNVDVFRLNYTSNNATVNLGFYLDFIYLQDGVTPSPVSGTIVAYNGLTHFKNNGIDSIRLGGILNQNTNIDGGSLYTLTNTSSVSGSSITFRGINTGTGSGVYGEAVSGTGVAGVVTTGTAVSGVAGAGIGLLATSVSSFAGIFSINPSSTNTSPNVTQLRRQTTGTAANNIGMAVDFASETTDGNLYSSNQLTGKWTDATTGTRTSQFIISGVNSTTTQNLLSLAGTGQLTLDQYTTANFNGGAAADSVLVVTSAGIVKKRDAASFAGSTYTASNGLTMTANNTVLGGTLTGNTTIATTAAFTLTVSGSVPSATAAGTFIVTNGDATGRAISATVTGASQIGIVSTSSAGNAVYGLATSGIGIKGEATSGTALYGFATSGTPLNILAFPSSTNTVAPVALVQRLSSGSAANGIGGSIDFYTQTTVGGKLSNQVVSNWTNATDATRTSQMVLTGVLSASTVNLLTLNANGTIQLRPITAAAASAITPAEGMMVFVSDTDGTFVSIGFWGYRNGAWAAF